MSRKKLFVSINILIFLIYALPLTGMRIYCRVVTDTIKKNISVEQRINKFEPSSSFDVDGVTVSYISNAERDENYDDIYFKLEIVLLLEDSSVVLNYDYDKFEQPLLSVGNFDGIPGNEIFLNSLKTEDNSSIIKIVEKDGSLSLETEPFQHTNRIVNKEYFHYLFGLLGYGLLSLIFFFLLVAGLVLQSIFLLFYYLIKKGKLKN